MTEGVPSLPPISVRSRLPAHLQSQSAGEPFPELVEDGGAGVDRSAVDGDASEGAQAGRRDSVMISAEARDLFRRGGADLEGVAADPTPPSTAAEPPAGIDVTV